MFQDAATTNMFPLVHAICQTVRPWIIHEALVEAVHGRQKDDRIDVIEVGAPDVSLSSCHVKCHQDDTGRNTAYRCT